MPVVEERLSKVEIAIQDFVHNVGVEFNKLYNLQIQSAIKFDEFKEESEIARKRADKQWAEFKEEMKEFKDEMKEFKDEMTDYKAESEADRKRMNKQWGELAHKMGTVVEDIVTPSIPRIIRQLFGFEEIKLMVRIFKKLKDGTCKEYDAFAISGDYLFVNSTKSTLRSENITEFVEDIKILRHFFPEYKNKKIIGIIASLNLSEHLTKFAEKTGFVVLGMGDDAMDMINTKGFKPKTW